MVKLSSVGDETKKENKKLQVRRLFKQRYHELRYECCKEQNKNDSRTLIGKPKKLYQFV